MHLAGGLKSRMKEERPVEALLAALMLSTSPYLQPWLWHVVQSHTQEAAQVADYLKTEEQWVAVGNEKVQTMEFVVLNLCPGVRETQLDDGPCSDLGEVIVEHQGASQPGLVQPDVGCNSDLVLENWHERHQAD